MCEKGGILHNIQYVTLKIGAHFNTPILIPVPEPHPPLLLIAEGSTPSAMCYMQEKYNCPIICHQNEQVKIVHGAPLSILKLMHMCYLLVCAHKTQPIHRMNLYRPGLLLQPDVGQLGTHINSLKGKNKNKTNGHL